MTASQTSSTTPPCSKLLTEKALARFATKCCHNPITGCVEWIGGQTAAHGHTAFYGAFWFEGKRWPAHRWAAKFIHGMEIEDRLIQHTCPNLLCQQHLVSIRPVLSETEMRYRWVRIQYGLDELPPEEEQIDLNQVPFFIVPSWLAPFIKESKSDDCPF